MYKCNRRETVKPLWCNQSATNGAHDGAIESARSYSCMQTSSSCKLGAFRRTTTVKKRDRDGRCVHLVGDGVRAAAGDRDGMDGERAPWHGP